MDCCTTAIRGENYSRSLISSHLISYTSLCWCPCLSVFLSCFPSPPLDGDDTLSDRAPGMCSLKAWRRRPIAFLCQLFAVVVAAAAAAAAAVAVVFDVVPSASVWPAFIFTSFQTKYRLIECLWVGSTVMSCGHWFPTNE